MGACPQFLINYSTIKIHNEGACPQSNRISHNVSPLILPVLHRHSKILKVLDSNKINTWYCYQVSISTCPKPLDSIAIQALNELIASWCPTIFNI